MSFEIPVQFYLAGIEPASNPNDGEDKHLLEEEGDDHSQECGLSHQLYEQDVDKSHNDMG